MAGANIRRRRPDHRLLLPALQVVGLGALWLVFSGKLDALHAVFGVFSLALVLWRTKALVVSERRPEESVALASIRPLLLARYGIWLLKEIVVANIDIAKIVLRRDMPIEPALVSFESSLTTDLARVLLGNSITLTPGTLTVEIDGNRFLVHGIVESGATGPVIDEMQRKIAEMLGEPEPPKLRYHVAYTIAGARGGKR
jgi:multicomponent Na+:H+ antiporter subunit E